MVHEATHLLLDRAVDSPLARVPAWLNEGLAMYFESDSYRREATVARAARDSALLRLGAMNTVPGRPEDVRQFYAAVLERGRLHDRNIRGAAHQPSSRRPRRRPAHRSGNRGRVRHQPR